MRKQPYTRADLARVILGLTYGDLMEVAGEFAHMIEPGVRETPTDDVDFASLLHDWAGAEEM